MHWLTPKPFAVHLPLHWLNLDRELPEKRPRGDLYGIHA